MRSIGVSLPQARQIFRAHHFTVRDLKENPAPDLQSRNSAPFYKMFHVTSGKGLLLAGARSYVLTPGDVAFVPPEQKILWNTLSPGMDGYSCFVHPKFFKCASHVLHMFLAFPHAQPEHPIVSLNQIQSTHLRQSFEMMHQEFVGSYDDKKQAILIHLQMILLKIRRAGKSEGTSSRRSEIVNLLSDKRIP